jgi:hypothetical protein
VNFRTSRWLVGLALVCLPLSCSRLPRSSSPGEGGELVVESLTVPDSVPSEWGELVSVVNAPGSEDWLVFCFQDEGGVVRLVYYNVRSARLSAGARVIGRS